MNARDLFGGNFWLAIVSQQSIDLLLDVSQLRVTKTGEKGQRRNAFHQVAVLLNQYLRSFERIIKTIKHVALLGRDVGRNRQEPSDLGEHDRLTTIFRTTREQRFAADPHGSR